MDETTLIWTNLTFKMWKKKVGEDCLVFLGLDNLARQ